jgi:hypothetical protein
MARLAPEGLIGIHTNLLVTALGGAPQPTETDEEKAAAKQGADFRQTGFGYFLEQATRPQTIGYALLDSPVALAAWMLDHDTDSYYKISGAFVEDKPTGGLTRDHILDNITLYWLTGTGASAARSYWESGQAQATAAAAGQTPPEAKVAASRSSRARSAEHRAAGWSRATPTSSTSTRPTRAGTSPPGSSPRSSPTRSGRRSSHCGTGARDEHRRAHQPQAVADVILVTVVTGLAYSIAGSRSADLTSGSTIAPGPCRC